MDYREYLPHLSLRDSVRCYWSLSSLHTAATEEHWFCPESMVRLVFYSGEAYMDDAAGQPRPLEPVYALGLRDGATGMVSKGMTHALGVELLQGGNQALQSLTQVGGPLLSGQLYSRVSAGTPFWAGAAMVLIGAIALLTGRATRSPKPLEAH